MSPNRLTRLLQAKREAGENILDLTESNPTRAGLAYPEEEILSSLQDRRTLAYEPAARGLERTRRAVAEYYLGRGREVSPDDFLLTASTSEAYAFLFKVLADSGDEVLIPRPSYPLFDYLAALESVEPISYPLVYDGTWSIDWDQLEKAVGPRARAILVVHPGNPSGSYLKRSELERLLAICRRHDMALVADEVFFDYALAEDAARSGSLVGEMRVLTFVLSGLSKVAGLPQMKLSWIWIGGPEGPRQEACQRLEHVSDMFLSVGTPVQHAAERLFDLVPRIQMGISERLASNHELLREMLSPGSPVSMLKVEGGWYATLRVPAVRSSEAWAIELLASGNLYVHPGYLFEFPIEACLIVSLLTPTPVLRAGVDRLLRSVEQVSGPH